MFGQFTLGGGGAYFFVCFCFHCADQIGTQVKITPVYLKCQVVSARAEWRQLSGWQEPEVSQ